VSIRLSADLRRLRALAAALARLVAASLLQPLAAALAPAPQLASSFGRHARHV